MKLFSIRMYIKCALSPILFSLIVQHYYVLNRILLRILQQNRTGEEEDATKRDQIMLLKFTLAVLMRLIIELKGEKKRKKMKQEND